MLKDEIEKKKLKEEMSREKKLELTRLTRDLGYEIKITS